VKVLIGSKNDNSPLINVVLLVFIPTTLLTVSYVLLGYIQHTIPSLLLFYTLATFILFPFELAVVLNASKKQFGSYSLRSAFVNQEKTNWKKTLIYGLLLFGLAGILSVTINPLEKWITTPLAENIPTYFDWNNMEYLRQYPKNILVITFIVYGLFNVLVGPVVEELYFRGYLTSRISRFGKWSPVIITVLFSLYHLWLPLQNIFRICVFLPAAYFAWKEKNIYISIVLHCLSNLVSTISLIVAVYAVA
jgi:membrane protease YdiL (CAAX protease family)